MLKEVFFIALVQQIAVIHTPLREFKKTFRVEKLAMAGGGVVLNSHLSPNLFVSTHIYIVFRLSKGSDNF